MSTVSPTLYVMRALFLVTLVLGVAALAHEANYIVQGLNPSTKWLNIGCTLLHIAAVLQLGQSGYVEEVLGKTLFQPKYKVSNLPLPPAPVDEDRSLPVRLRLSNMVYKNALIGFALLGVSGAVRMYTTYL